MIHPERVAATRARMLDVDDAQGCTVYYRVDDTHVRLLLDVAVEHYLHGRDHR